MYRGCCSIVISQFKEQRVVFTAKRKSERWKDYLVTGPQGRCEHNENFAKTMLREAYEECGIQSYMIKEIAPAKSFKIDSEDNGILVKPFVILLEWIFLNQILKKQLGNGELYDYELYDLHALLTISKYGQIKIQPHCKYLLTNNEIIQKIKCLYGF